MPKPPAAAAAAAGAGGADVPAPAAALPLDLLSAPAARSAALAAGVAALAGWAWFCAPGSPGLAAAVAAAARAGTRLVGTSAAAQAAAAGLAAGCLHTLSGPDHLAALTPLTIGRTQSAAALMGALWGFGHSIGQLLLGLAMLLLKDRFTSLVPALTKYGSTTVGATLLAIGALGLYETWAEHTGGGEEEAGTAAAATAAAPAASSSSPASSSKPATLTTRAISGAWTLAAGIVYGLQPDALFVIIPALALPTRAAAGAYILTFVIGTVAAMGGYAAAIGATSRALIEGSGGGGGADGDDGGAAARRRTARLSGAASLVALGVGCAVLASSWGVPWWPAVLGGGAH